MKRVLLGLFCLPLTLLAQSSAGTPEQKEFFESHVRPVLAQNCFACHTNSQMGGLRLDSREDLLKGGKSGPAIVPGDPEKSMMITAIRQITEIKMPKNGHLTEAQINDLTAWVKDGAVWPVEDRTKSAGQGYVIRPEQRKFWSFQPLQKASPPRVNDATWPVNDIDRFILAKLEKEGMKPAAAADRRTLLRRVSYDLTGLPPTYEEVKDFENDKSPNAFEKVVDRLLASPRYGEMWARHWLDVVRYAEDDYRIAQKDMHKERYKFAYTYRDWVINALNTDMPFDTFVKAQLAGDLMDEKARDKMIPGLGMNGLGVWQFNDSPPAIERADEWHDKVDATTTFMAPPPPVVGNYIWHILEPEILKPDYQFLMDQSTPRKITMDEDYGELKRHRWEFRHQTAFAYGILTPDAKEEVACVYVKPSKKQGYDAIVKIWVGQRAAKENLEPILKQQVREWIQADWPFQRVAYSEEESP